MKAIIDRFEGEYAVLELESNIFVQIPSLLVPQAHEGDVVDIRIDRTATEKRKEDISRLSASLFEE